MGVFVAIAVAVAVGEKDWVGVGVGVDILPEPTLNDPSTEVVVKTAPFVSDNSWTDRSIKVEPLIPDVQLIVATEKDPIG